MKFSSILKISTLIVLIGIFLSCEPTDVLPTNTSGNLSAQIGSTSFASKTVDAVLFASDIDTNLQIVATNTNGDIIVLNIKSLKEKSYIQTSGVSQVISFEYKPSTNGVTTTETSTTGNLTLSTHDAAKQLVSGTFNFTTSKHQINTGVFTKIKY